MKTLFKEYNINNIDVIILMVMTQNKMKKTKKQFTCT